MRNKITKEEYMEENAMTKSNRDQLDEMHFIDDAGNHIKNLKRQNSFLPKWVGESNEDNNLKEIISQVVDDFSFPDGCLELGKNEQEKFIEALEQRIKDGYKERC